MKTYIKAIISMEKYKYTPSLELAFKIAELFNISINEVYIYKGGENVNEQTIILFFLIDLTGIILFLSLEG